MDVRRIDFRGVAPQPDRTPLLIAGLLAVTPAAVLLFALVTGRIHEMLGEEGDALLLVGFPVGWAVLFLGGGFVLDFMIRRGCNWVGADHFVRVDSDGLEIRHVGRTWRAPWHEIRVEYRTGDEDFRYLGFRDAAGKRLEYPDLLNPTDTADLFAVLRVRLPGADLETPQYTPEVARMLRTLEKTADPVEAEDLCGRVLAAAEPLSAHGYGMLPVLEACAHALDRLGLRDRASDLGDRAEALRREIRT